MSENKKKILIVDDEKNIVEILSYNVEKEGYLFDTAYDGATALEKALSGRFDLILLDVMLPIYDGFTVCKKIREKLDTPIIMLTARGEESDKITGLDIGADDYMTKPFSIGELNSRIKANIRRYSGEARTASKDASNDNIIVIEDMEINLDRYSIKISGEEITLSKKEYELIEFLAKNRGKPYQREELLSEVWGYDDFYGDQRTVDVTISRLRKKIEADPSEPKYIQNKRGVGYYMA